MSVDGCIDDATDKRLLLSNAADFDRVDEVRAQSDAILIGATTLRRDNPRLLVNSEERRAARVARGLPAYPLKVTLTSSGNLDPALKFWHHGGEKVVYCPSHVVAELHGRLAGLAEVVGLGGRVNFATMLDHLGARGVRQLMVEGGTAIHTQFLALGLADEIHLAVAPFFVGNPAAPRFVGFARFPQDPMHRMELVETRSIGDIALLRYRPQRADELPATAEPR